MDVSDESDLSYCQRSDMERTCDFHVDGWAGSEAPKLQMLAAERLPTQQPASFDDGLGQMKAVSDEHL